MNAPQLPKLPPMGYENDGYSVSDMHAYAALAAREQRERDAAICEEKAAQHVEASEAEDDEDYRQRCLVYAKHVRRCAAAILAQPEPGP